MRSWARLSFGLGKFELMLQASGYSGIIAILENISSCNTKRNKWKEDYFCEQVRSDTSEPIKREI